MVFAHLILTCSNPEQPGIASSSQPEEAGYFHIFESNLCCMEAPSSLLDDLVDPAETIGEGAGRVYGGNRPFDSPCRNEVPECMT